MQRDRGSAKTSGKTPSQPSRKAAPSKAKAPKSKHVAGKHGEGAYAEPGFDRPAQPGG